jgi:predicted  nucleic acid-binding Zn-ribbon protein
MVYAETLFLQKMTRKNFLTQMRQVDNGDNSARMHEVINQTIREIRENSKFSSSQRTELEEYYKKFREDLGEVSQSMKSESASANDDGQIVDSKKLNDLITEAMKNKKPKT